MASGYNVKLVFAIAAGNYVSDVEITIHDHSGNSVLDARANGPWFFVKLPQGTYRVSASYEGVKRCHSIQAGATQKTMVFHWGSKDVVSSR